MTDQALLSKPDGVVDQYKLQALVGWTHATLPQGVDLRIQCADSMLALENQQISVQHVLMTRNQALLLARYLLEITGQTLPVRRKPSLLGRFWRRNREARA